MSPIRTFGIALIFIGAFLLLSYNAEHCNYYFDVARVKEFIIILGSITLAFLIFRRKKKKIPLDDKTLVLYFSNETERNIQLQLFCPSPPYYSYTIPNGIRSYVGSLYPATIEEALLYIRAESVDSFCIKKVSPSIHKVIDVVRYNQADGPPPSVLRSFEYGVFYQWNNMADREHEIAFRLISREEIAIVFKMKNPISKSLLQK